MTMQLRAFFHLVLLLFTTILWSGVLRADNGATVYQANTSIADAMLFIGISADKQAKYLGSVKGRLPAGAEKVIVDRLVRLGAERSVTLFLELTGQKTVAALKTHVGNDDVVNRMLGSIGDGSFLGAPPGTRYFASVIDLSDAEKAAYAGRQGVKFDPPPSATITFHYFSDAQNRLIGSRFEVAQKGAAFVLSLPTFRPDPK
jgi:hypothetical protein